MPDVPLVSPINFQTLRLALGRGPDSDGRVETLIVLARRTELISPTRLADLAGKSLPAVRKNVILLAEHGFAEIVEDEGHNPQYRPTILGQRVAFQLEALRLGSLGADLVGHVLICATRAKESNDGSLRAAMLERSLAVLTGAGSLQYVGICADDPELYEALQGRIEQLKARPSMLRVSEIVSR